MQTVGLYIEKGPFFHTLGSLQMGERTGGLCVLWSFQGYLGFRGVKEPGVVNLC